MVGTHVPDAIETLLHDVDRRLSHDRLRQQFGDRLHEQRATNDAGIDAEDAVELRKPDSSDVHYILALGEAPNRERTGGIADADARSQRVDEHLERVLTARTSRDTAAVDEEESEIG